MALVKGTAVQSSLAERQLGAQEPGVVRKMGLASCDHGVTGVYKILFRVGSPEFIISRAARVFSSYYDTGELKMVEGGAGRAVVDLSALEGARSQFCERIFVWMQRTLDLAGAKSLRSAHSACVHPRRPRLPFRGNLGLA